MLLEIERIASQKAEKLDYTKHGHNYFSHGFARISSAEVLGKTQLSPTIDSVQAGIDRLQQVFRYGILSQRFAERIGAAYGRNYSDSNNVDFVSLVGRYSGAWKAMSHARAGWLGEWSFFQNPPPGSMFTVFIDPNLGINGNDISEGAVLRRGRVPQKAFLGIGGYRLSESPETLRDVVDLMLTTYFDRPELVVPVYEVNGVFPNLLWPKTNSTP